MAGECKRQPMWALPKDIREKSYVMPVKAHHEEMCQPLSRSPTKISVDDPAWATTVFFVGLKQRRLF
jgi:hypothetical protein